jgi:hypothetical protein
MKKISTTNRARERRGRGARISTAIDSVNGKSRSIELPRLLHSDGPLRQAATKNPPDSTAAVLEQLFGALCEVTTADHPRTFKLLQSGRRKLSRKLIEEA